MSGLNTGASREASPLSAMITSQESSPSAFFNNSPSPGNGIDFITGTMVGGAPNNNWAAGLDGFANHGVPAQNGISPNQMPRMPPAHSYYSSYASEIPRGDTDPDQIDTVSIATRNYEASPPNPYDLET